MWIQDNVFNGAKTRLVLADAKLKGLREVGEFSAEERAEMNNEGDSTSNAEAVPGGDATPVTPGEEAIPTDSTRN
jgi:hypothetical protein